MASMENDTGGQRRKWLAACFGKQAFDSRQVAEGVARRHREKEKYIHAYKCKCGKYHIGKKDAGYKALTRLSWEKGGTPC